MTTRRRQKIYYAIFVLAWVAFSVTVSQFAIFLPMVGLLGQQFKEPLWTLIYYILYSALSLSLVLFVPPQLRKLYRRNHTPKEKTSDDELFSTNAEELGVSNWPTFVDIGLAPIAYFAYAIIVKTLTSLLDNFTWFNANQQQDVGFSYFLTTEDRVLAMLAIVFIAPIAEELIMRGWLYGKLRNQFKIPLAIFLTSALFAVLHGQLNVGVSVFVLSVILCGLREITGTIWSGMLLHILSNGIAFYILYVAI